MLINAKEEALMTIIERMTGELGRRRKNGASKRISDLFEGARTIHASLFFPTIKREQLLMAIVGQMMDEYCREKGENEQVYNLHEAALHVHNAENELEFNKALGWTIPPITEIRVGTGEE